MFLNEHFHQKILFLKNRHHLHRHHVNLNIVKKKKVILGYQKLYGQMVLEPIL